MTKITLTWQKDDDHKTAYTEDVDLTARHSTKPSIEERVLSIVESEENNPFKLDNVARVTTALTLENCVDQLFIVKALLNEATHASCFEIFKYRTLGERFAVTKKSKKQFEEEEYEKIRYTDTEKMRDDVCFICSTLLAGSKEVIDTGMYTCLLRVIVSVEQQYEDTEELAASIHEREVFLEDLKHVLLKDKKDSEKQLREAIETLHCLRNTVEDILGYGKAELNYVDAWEGTRKYQNHLKLTGQENVFNNIIEGTKTKVEHENRIHNEIQNFISENTDDLLDGIQYWMRRYDEEIERRDSEIYQLRSTWEVLSEDHVKLKELYEEHRAAVEEWLAIKEERRKAEELLQLQHRCAIRIQAWWRGTMVRKKLGPFRVKKKGKKGDKKGKGKGKKK